MRRLHGQVRYKYYDNRLVSPAYMRVVDLSPVYDVAPDHFSVCSTRRPSGIALTASLLTPSVIRRPWLAEAVQFRHLLDPTPPRLIHCPLGGKTFPQKCLTKIKITDKHNANIFLHTWEFFHHRKYSIVVGRIN